MILVDTSIWIDHIRRSDPTLSYLLRQRLVLVHPLVIGELAMGSHADRNAFLYFLHKFREPKLAHHNEVHEFVAKHELFSRGIGFIDAHLLASAKLTPETELWTRDKRLHELATRLAVAFLGG